MTDPKTGLPVTGTDPLYDIKYIGSIQYKGWNLGLSYMHNVDAVHEDYDAEYENGGWIGNGLNFEVKTVAEAKAVIDSLPADFDESDIMNAL